MSMDIFAFFLGFFLGIAVMVLMYYDDNSKGV
jgi:hypothetical protein